MRIIFILPIIFLISSCGYSSYDECMKEEIKDNQGKYSAYIARYCRDKFPTKYRKGISAKENFLKQKENLNDSSEIKWQSNPGKITITNQSTNKTINAVAYYMTETCDGKVDLDWDDYSYINVNVGPGQIMTYTILVPKGSGCIRTHRKGS